MELEDNAKKEATRANTLKDKLIELEKNDEKAKCAMPNFMRDAFRGLR